MWTLKFPIRVCDTEVTGTIPELQVHLSAKQFHNSSQSVSPVDQPIILLPANHLVKGKNMVLLQRLQSNSKVCPSLGASLI